jgi:hypothetical protein
MAPPRTQRCHLCGQEAQIQACTHRSDHEILAVTGCGCGGFEIRNCLLWQLTIPVMAPLEQERLASRIRERRLAGGRVRLVLGVGGAVEIDGRLARSGSRGARRGFPGQLSPSRSQG